MLARIALALALPVAAMAQIQVSYLPDSSTVDVIPSGGTQNVGTVAAGENVSLHFRIQNLDSQNATVIGSVNVGRGAGFAIPDPPPLEYTLAPLAEVDFHVVFAPTSPGNYVSVLLIDSFSAQLTGNAIAIPQLGDSTGATWLAGDTIGFPQLQVGGSVTKSYMLVNQWNTAVTVTTLTVSGGGFSGPAGITLPLILTAGASSPPFQITFAPTTSGTSNGILSVNGQAFGLTGTAVQPPLPAATIQIAAGANSSAEQASITIELAAAAPAPGSGTLTMTFTPASSGAPDDPAIQFLDTGSRSVNVQIAQGATSATFGSGSDCPFQTGTTAGTIGFTLSLGNQTVQNTLTIPPQAMNFDTKTARIQGSGINVMLAGFDNTHAASGLAFTFYDANGKEIPGGVIPVDVTSAFSQFFSTNAALTGGLFELTASFPVTGVVTEIGAVAITATNPAGTSQSIQIPVTE